ncbi:UNVERIFIED_CONTAM: Branched-chain amino acid aminotransferase 2, chloroplastic [Sesamum angustifolium]|uniref:Branched-chain amino acid aminotransferase 2, chloroplastic n=1 Tax=Sesamum angustifolium TaxID=2727405 RepID=A0AAW2RN16_9LAMI
MRNDLGEVRNVCVCLLRLWKQFLEAVKVTVLANERWIPPPGKGALYIRPLLIGSGAVLGIAPAPECTFLMYASPVGNYFKVVLEESKTIGNYGAVLNAQIAAKAKGFSDVLYLDSIHNTYLEEGNLISTPTINGTILPGITRKSILELARSLGFQVEERLIRVDELVDADEVFCTGTAVVVSPVGSITYLNKRISYGSGGVGRVSQQLYSALTNLQMGLTDDKMGWVIHLK